MKKPCSLLSGIAFFFAGCEKEGPIPLPQGTFTATSITENLPIHGFTKNGAIAGSKTINRILDDYDNYIPESWDLSFTSVEIPEGQIRIQDSFIEYTFMSELLKYDYTRNDDLLFLEMQDSITITASYSDYYIQLFNTLNVYPLPEFSEYYVPTPTGFYAVSRYKDKRYIEIIDENTLRMHFTRHLYVVNYTTTYQTFWILPVELNNYFRETGYAAIKEGDAVLVKEFEIEYRSK
ncbi:MAG: hypothetical protein PHI28_14830 [Mangrovibacterium sp.]|nr:hypothetical protein [Mangrovibacterium sp.]